MTLFELFERLEEAAIGEAIRNSLWLFPVVEAVHLVGLALLGGSVIVVELRMLGLTLRTLPVATVVRNTRPYLILAIVVMFATGIPLALSEMIKLYYNFSWWVKITTLPIAILYTFLIHDRFAVREESGRWLLGVLGMISLLLWFTVAGAGRWIGFS